MDEAPALRRIAGIRARQQERMREEAARLQAKVSRLKEQEQATELQLRHDRRTVAAATAARHAAMEAEPASLKRLGALLAGIEAGQQALANKAAELGECREAHATAVDERIAHNQRLNRVRRQCQGLETLIETADAAAEIRAELQQD